MDSNEVYVYILQCSDGAYYVGQTNDLKVRLSVHNSGKGPKFTATRTPVKLLYYESFSNRAKAMARESQLKRWSRPKKEALINQDIQKLHSLAKRNEQ